MATRIHDATGTRVIGQHLPLGVLLAAIPSLPRPILSRLVARAIEHIDSMDGDPDVEPNGDEKDTGNAEDEVYTGDPYFLPAGPGCSVSDPGEMEERDDDRDGDQ